MLRVLLLDCSAALQSRLKDQGFRVEAGTVGFCTGVRQLPSQIYEQDVIFYNPESVPKDGTVSKDIFKDLTPQYDVAHLEGRVRDGATFVAFINPISPASMLQRIFYGWIPYMPALEPTSDKVIVGNPFNSFPDSDARVLAPLVAQANLSLPVLLKLKPGKPQDYPRDTFNLFWNARGDCLGVQILRGHGSLIFLPKYKSNDDVIETFLHRVVPRIYRTNAKSGLTDIFSSPAEELANARLQKLELIEQKLKENQQEARVQLANATREKANVIRADATAKQILTYYDLAKRQDDAALFYLYKIVEAVENKLGGEAEAIKLVGGKTEWKRIKRLANESYRDARHAPKPGDVIKEWSNTEIKQAFEDVQIIVRGYFATLFPSTTDAVGRESSEGKQDDRTVGPAN